MASLVGEPHEEGLQILKDELFEKIKKFALVSDADEIYYENTVHSVGSDADGVLVVVVLIPIEEHFTKWNKSLYLLTEDDIKITVIQTPSIQFVKGVGGEQVIKLTVSAEPSQLFFKADDYLTDFEFKNKIEGYGVDLSNGFFISADSKKLNGLSSEEINPIKAKKMLTKLNLYTPFLRFQVNPLASAFRLVINGTIGNFVFCGIYDVVSYHPSGISIVKVVDSDFGSISIRAYVDVVGSGYLEIARMSGNDGDLYMEFKLIPYVGNIYFSSTDFSKDNLILSEFNQQ